MTNWNWNWWPVISVLAILVAFMVGWTSVRRVRCRVRVTSWAHHKAAWSGIAIVTVTLITLMAIFESHLGILDVAQRFLSDGESEAAAVVFAFPIILVGFNLALYLTLFAAATAGENLHEYLAQQQADEQMERCRKVVDIQCPWVLENCPCRNKAKAVITADAFRNAKRSHCTCSDGLEWKELDLKGYIRPSSESENHSPDDDQIG